MDKNKTIVFSDRDKLIRNIIVVAGIFVIIIIVCLNLFMGVGRQIRPVIYSIEGRNVIYDLKSEKEIDSKYMCFNNNFIEFDKYGGGEFKAHFDSPVYYKAEKNDNGFDIYYFNKKDWVFLKSSISAMRFAQNGKDAILFELNESGNYNLYFILNGKEKNYFENCLDAMAIGAKKSEYFIYTQNDGKTMFYNFNKEPFELKISGVDIESASLSADKRKFMFIAGAERKLYVFNIDMTEETATNALEVGQGIIKASFTGLKSDFAFLDSKNDFYYSSGGYTFKEDENVKKFEAGFDVMTMYYLKNNGEFYSIYVGKEKKMDEDIEDFYYIGSNNTAVIKYFDNDNNEGNLCFISSSNVSESDIKIERFLRY